MGTYAEDMYENGNKIGSMGGSTIVDGDGDINKRVGMVEAVNSNTEKEMVTCMM